MHLLPEVGKREEAGEEMDAAIFLPKDQRKDPLSCLRHETQSKKGKDLYLDSGFCARKSELQSLVHTLIEKILTHRCS